MLSPNADNNMANMLYLHQLINTYKPGCICIQEHWLFNFEQKQLSKVHPEYVYAAKSVHNYDKMSAKQRPRGYGGVSTLWKKSISAKVYPDGSYTALEVQLNNNITIVNTDIPCRGAYCGDEYQDEMYQISELCIKFGNSHITLPGDMNSVLVCLSLSLSKDQG